MASGKTHKITIGGETIDVPAWATEEQFSTLLKIDTNVLKSLDAMLRANRKSEKSQKDDNKALLDSLNEVAKQAQKSAKTKAKTESRVFDKFFKNIDREVAYLSKAYKKGAGEQLKSEKAIQEFLTKAGKGMAKSSTNFAKGLDSVDLKGMATAVGSVAGLGTVAGFAAGIMEGFMKSMIDLSNTGVGLGTSLIDLRNAAAGTGLNLEGYSKIVNGNVEAIKSLGSSTTEGAMRFATLSREMKISTRDFNNFGLTNTELNESLAEEIELRRLSGMSQQSIQNGLTDSMTKLMLETTQMAAATGQDRRELIRRRNEALRSEVVQAKLIAMQREGMDTTAIRDKIDAITSTLGKGNEGLSLAMAEAAMSGLDFMSIDGGKYGSLAAMLGEEGGGILRDIFNTYSSGLMDANISSEELNSIIAAKVGSLGEAGSSALFDSLSQIAGAGGNMSGVAKDVIKLIGGLSGISSDIVGINETAEKTKDGLKTESLLAVPSAMEEAANRIKASMLTTVLDTFGVDIKGAGDSLVKTIQDIGDSFGPHTGVVEGSVDAFTKLNFATQALITAFGAAAAISAAGSALGAYRGVKGLMKARTAAGGRYQTVRPSTAPNHPRAPLSPSTAPRTTTPPSTAPRTTTPPPVPPSGAPRTGGTLTKSLMKKVPGLGLLTAGGFALDRIMNDGDITGALLELASGGMSLIPGVGTAASVAIDASLAARDAGLINTGSTSTNEEMTDFDSWTDVPNKVERPEIKITGSGRGDGNIELNARRSILKEEDRKKKLIALESALSQLVKVRGTVGDTPAAVTIDAQIQNLASQITELQGSTDESKAKPSVVKNSKLDQYNSALNEYSDIKNRIADFAAMVKDNPNLYSEEQEAKMINSLSRELGDKEQQLSDMFSGDSTLLASERTKELAAKMGITDTSNLSAKILGGSTITEINGQAVPKELFNEFEVERLNNWKSFQESMGNGSLDSTTQEVRDVLSQQSNNDEMSITELRNIVYEMRENNRILRKQLRTTEDAFF